MTHPPSRLKFLTPLPANSKPFRCYTKGSCGHTGVGGHYDYCKYAPNSTFEALSADEKLAYFWARISEGLL